MWAEQSDLSRCLIEQWTAGSVSCEYLDNEAGQVRSRDGDVQDDIWVR